MTTDPLSRRDIPTAINAAGTLTSLGSSRVSKRVTDSMAHVLSLFIPMLELQRAASREIADGTGAQAGFVSHCAAAGIIAGIAAAMTGTDFAHVEQLPDTSAIAKNEVIIQRGHVVHYGGRITQNIRTTGAKVVEIGDATRCGTYQLAGAITDRTAAALFVVSHHTVDYGQIRLDTFVQTAHDHGVPVIVDAASEYDFRSFVERGADLVVFSGHKFLGGPTSGVVCGNRELVRAALCQERGICRPMKASKEAVVGCLEALAQWNERDARAEREAQEEILHTIYDRIHTIDGLSVTRDPDPTGNPITRLKVAVDERKLGVSAFAMLCALSGGDPPVYLRALEIDRGYFHIDPCNLLTDEVEPVCAAIERYCNSPWVPERFTPNEADAEIAGYQSWP